MIFCMNVRAIRHFTYAVQEKVVEYARQDKIITIPASSFDCIASSQLPGCSEI